MNAKQLIVGALTCVMILGATGPVWSQTPVGTQAPDYKMTNHRVVLITDQSLNPRVVTLDKGQLVAWISYSAAESIVVFEREVAKKMVCHHLVNFSLKDDELRSAPIHAGEFASFCQLEPGRYRYKVTRPQALERDDARRQLDGEIIVGNPNMD